MPRIRNDPVMFRLEDVGERRVVARLVLRGNGQRGEDEESEESGLFMTTSGESPSRGLRRVGNLIYNYIHFFYQYARIFFYVFDYVLLEVMDVP